MYMTKLISDIMKKILNYYDPTCREFWFWVSQIYIYIICATIFFLKLRPDTTETLNIIPITLNLNSLGIGRWCGCFSSNAMFLLRLCYWCCADPILCVISHSYMYHFVKSNLLPTRRMVRKLLIFLNGKI